MASFKAKFAVLQELFAKNHGGPFGPHLAGRVLLVSFPDRILIQHGAINLQPGVVCKVVALRATPDEYFTMLFNLAISKPWLQRIAFADCDVFNFKYLNR